MDIYLPIGSSPVSENCAQVGREGYEILARVECRAFIGQLKRHFQEVHDRPASCRLLIKGNNHDFGRYYEVNAVFDEADTRAEEDAYWLEAKTPENWDNQARSELPLPVLPYLS